MPSYTAVVHKEDDMYVAYCPEVGTASQGHTEQQAIANLKEATELYLEEADDFTPGRPTITTFEVAGDAKA